MPSQLVKTTRKNSKSLVTAVCAGFLGVYLSSQDFSRVSSILSGGPEITKEMIADRLKEPLNANTIPSQLEMDLKGTKASFKIESTLNQNLQFKAEQIFKSYRPDYGSLVAMDAKTGELLSLVSFMRTPRAEAGHLALRATYPAASVFKVVTAAAAIDNHKVTPETVIEFQGANHTLYRRNIQETQNRWMRHMTVREAFGKSINTVFGKLGLFYVGANPLRDYAERFFFNRPIPTDLPVETGQTTIPEEDSWGVAEVASGFTRKTVMSPVQGAMIAAAVVNDGVMVDPYFVRSLTNSNGEVLYQNQPRSQAVVMTPETAKEMRVLMEETVRRGTSRKAFRKMLARKQYADVDLGGKTGSLTGTQPAGKYDWFIGYARMEDRHVAIAVLTIHGQLWRVKSAQVAAEYFQDYVQEARIDRTRDRMPAKVAVKDSRFSNSNN